MVKIIFDNGNIAECHNISRIIMDYDDYVNAECVYPSSPNGTCVIAFLHKSKEENNADNK